MVAPLFPAVSSRLPPTEKALVSESTPSQHVFPNEFPYEFDTSTFSAAFTSPEDSTETEDETTDDEDDFLAGLTRRLALSTQRFPSPPSFVTDNAEVKPHVTANSPESTLSLSGLGSPNGPFSQVPSPPPTSPFREEDTFKVITAAAGEVAKMKMANFNAKSKSRPNPNPTSFIPFPQNAAFGGYWVWQPQSPHFHQSQFRFGSTLQPALIAPPYPVRSVFAAPTAAKQPSAGTGVFLPRNYQNPSDSQKKSGGVGVTKKVVHQKSPKFEEFSGQCEPNSEARPSTGRSKNDCVAGGCLKKERPLPQLQEWMCGI